MDFGRFTLTLLKVLGAHARNQAEWRPIKTAPWVAWNLSHPKTSTWNYQVFNDRDSIAFFNHPSRLHVLLAKLIASIESAILHATPPMLLYPISSFLSCPISTSKGGRIVPDWHNAESRFIWVVYLSQTLIRCDIQRSNGEQPHQNTLPSPDAKYNSGGPQEYDQDPSTSCKFLVSKQVPPSVDLISHLQFATWRREHAQYPASFQFGQS